MKKTILTTSLFALALTTTLPAAGFFNDLDGIIKRMKGVDTKPAIISGSLKLPLLSKKAFSKHDCDKTLNNGYFITCYNYKMKNPSAQYTLLQGNRVNSENIVKRPSFFADKQIPKKYRVEYKDYSRSGFDRGHSGANDASFDWSSKSLKTTYAMSNIIPQYPNTNRRSYLAVEKYERVVATKLGSVHAMTENFFSPSPIRIGRSKVAVPKGTKKTYWNDKADFKRCFYIPNDDVSYKLKKLEVNCSFKPKGVR